MTCQSEFLSPQERGQLLRVAKCSYNFLAKGWQLPREDDRLFHLFNTFEEEIECLYFPISGIAALQHIPKIGRPVDTAFSPPGPVRCSNYWFRPALCRRHRPARPQSPLWIHITAKSRKPHPRCFLIQPHRSFYFLRPQRRTNPKVKDGNSWKLKSWSVRSPTHGKFSQRVLGGKNIAARADRTGRRQRVGRTPAAFLYSLAAPGAPAAYPPWRHRPPRAASIAICHATASCSD
jgi:hypothetical protein